MSIAPMSQTDVVISGVKQMIVSHRLNPGDRLPIEKDLAAELQVSRGSLREGVRALSVMGILHTRQGAGTFVTDLDPAVLLGPMEFWVGLQAGNNASKIHTVRRSLEAEAASLAATKIDPAEIERARAILDDAWRAITSNPTDHEAAMQADLAFHKVIAEASGNEVLAALVDVFSARTVRGRMIRSLHDGEALEATHREHLGILHALSSGDPERSRVRMANHLYAVEEFISEHPDEPAEQESDSSLPG